MANAIILVFRPGTAVLLDGDIRGTVASVSVKEGYSIQYLVNWWNGRQRNSEWMEPHELRMAPESERVNLGFL